MKLFPCIESTYEFEVNGLQVRIWRDADSVFNANIAVHDDVVQAAAGHFDRKDIALAVAAVRGINAVQVKDPQTGYGLVIYVNWP